MNWDELKKVFSADRGFCCPAVNLTLFFACFVAWLIVSTSQICAEEAAEKASSPEIARIAVDASKIQISLKFPSNIDRKQITSFRVDRMDQGNALPNWVNGPRATDSAISSPIEIPRFENGRDLLFSRWRLFDERTKKVVGQSHFVDDLTKLTANPEPFRRAASIKGVQSIVDVDDAIRLGIKHAAHNVQLSQIVDLSGGSPQAVWKVDTEDIPIRLDTIHALDATFKRLTDAGVNNTIILLNSVPTAPDDKNPLIHPKTDLKRAPNHLGAFNLLTRKGYRYFRAALEYLSNRYSRPSGEHGWVSGYIIGNELQAHWSWYNMGPAKADDVIADYERALRVAHLAVRRFHPEARVYVSMDHHWTAQPDGDPLNSIAGKEFIDKLNALTKATGDFEWHVAFHPYPEDLFNPRTWNDKQPTLDEQTPKITFKNLEVLIQYLMRRETRFDGRLRRVILSEQGFHTLDSADGERLQAAAYAYAYYRASNLHGIDAFILHRHVDHRDEGGLKLGIWTRKPDSATTPDQKKLIYEVFRAADTDNWRVAFDFARPIIGIKRWEDLLPPNE